MKKALLSSALSLLSAFQLSAQQPLTPVLLKAVYFDVSPPLKEIARQTPAATDLSWKEGYVKNFSGAPVVKSGPPARESDASVQSVEGPVKSDTALVNFDGIHNVNNVVPPDTYGDAGPSHYFQLVNLSFAIFDRQGRILLGPLNTGTIWEGLPHNFNNGDGVVLYDEQADRWLISQFSFPTFPDAPFFQMVAVSQTGDPTGSWYRWEFSFNDLPDYPKFGVWPDGYYMSYTRIKSNSLQFAGIGAIAFNRDEMLSGDPDARAIQFVQPQLGSPVSLLPADCDGPFPVTGTPGYFAYLFANDLYIREFHADWINPQASAFGEPFRLRVLPYSFQNSGIPQKESDKLLTPLNDRLMYRLQFRDFGTYQSMVVNHTADVENRVGVRWYEFRKTSGNWFIRQQSTYAPDTLNRWMGSIAMDSDGNIALGYSVSAASVYPSIRATGRMKNDPLGEMTISEMTLLEGSGSQTGIWGNQSRWGDYSSMTVDPDEPCRFWYTQEYYQTTAWNSWSTRISSFSFANILSIEATATPDLSCDTSLVQLNVAVTGGSDTSFFAWSSDPPGFSSSLKDPVVAPSYSTRYIVSVTNGTQVKTDTVPVAVIPPPEVFAGPDTSLCRYVDALPLSGMAANNISVQWSSSGDGLFEDPAALNTRYHPGISDREGGMVTITLTAFPQSPCSPVSSSLLLTVDTCAGMGDLSADHIAVKIYPNPASGRLSVEISGYGAGEVTLQVTDLRGVILCEESLIPTTPSLSREINLSSYPAGALFLKVQTLKGWLVQPFVKE